MKYFPDSGRRWRHSVHVGLKFPLFCTGHGLDGRLLRWFRWTATGWFRRTADGLDGRLMDGLDGRLMQELATTGREVAPEDLKVPYSPIPKPVPLIPEP